MKKVLICLVLAVALTFAFAAAAFADHSPTFYVEWNPDSEYEGYNASWGNAGTGGPHSNYLEGTEKCGVCHSVHRAPVYGVKWDTNPADPTAYTAVAGGPGLKADHTLVYPKYKRQEFDNTAGGAAPAASTQMLLNTSVANSCDYCHIYTSTGGKQMYGGKKAYQVGQWNEGFGHGNGCSACHAVHGVSNNFGDAAQWGQYGTFQGPIKSLVLKVRAKGTGGAVGSAASYNWQDETVAIGSIGAAEFAASGIAGAAAWVGLFDANANGAGAYSNFDGAVRPAFPKWEVDPLNVPLFPSAADAVNGTNVRPGTDAKEAQAAIFCTFCHANYGYASEATVNPDGDRSLFQGPWYALAGTVLNVNGTAGTWTTMNGAGGYGAPFKNHPVKSVYGTFQAAGKSATVPAQVAFAGSETCVSCHDAGPSNPNLGVVIQSYPHVTPGYFHFVKSGAHVGAAMTNDPGLPDVISFSDAAGIAAAQAWLDDPVNFEEATTVQDGQCLKCHVNATDDAGVGKTY